jgi:hypothetical protein
MIMKTVAMQAATSHGFGGGPNSGGMTDAICALRAYSLLIRSKAAALAVKRPFDGQGLAQHRATVPSIKLRTLSYRQKCVFCSVFSVSLALKAVGGELIVRFAARVDRTAKRGDNGITVLSFPDFSCRYQPVAALIDWRQLIPPSER